METIYLDRNLWQRSKLLFGFIQQTNKTKLVFKTDCSSMD